MHKNLIINSEYILTYTALFAVGLSMLSLTGCDDSNPKANQPDIKELGFDKRTTVDFGFVEEIEDFTASDSFTLLNTSTHKLYITGIHKSCACYSVVLDPESEVLPGEDLTFSFRHANVTQRQGGFFYDKIGIELSDGNNSGMTVVEYLGYVIRSAVSAPDQIDFHQVGPADIGRTVVVILSLPNIIVVDGEPELVKYREVLSVTVPDYLDAKLVGLKDDYDVYQHVPYRPISEEYIDKFFNGTLIKQQLKRLLETQEDRLLSKEDLWYPVAITFRLKSLPDTNINGLAEVQTDLGPVNIPLSITLSTSFQVLPETLFWGSNASMPIQLSAHSNLSSLDGDTMQAIAGHPSLVIRVNESSANEWVGIVSIDRDAINEYPLKTEIEVISSSGKIKVPVTVLGVK